MSSLVATEATFPFDGRERDRISKPSAHLTAPSSSALANRRWKCCATQKREWKRHETGVRRSTAVSQGALISAETQAGSKRSRSMAARSSPTVTPSASAIRCSASSGTLDTPSASRWSDVYEIPVAAESSPLRPVRDAQEVDSQRVVDAADRYPVVVALEH